MAYPDTFQGFAAQSHERWTDFELLVFKPKTWSEDDIDIEITHCGVCGSDVHMISGVSLRPRRACYMSRHISDVLAPARSQDPRNMHAPQLRQYLLLIQTLGLEDTKISLGRGSRSGWHRPQGRPQCQRHPSRRCCRLRRTDWKLWFMPKLPRWP